MQGEERTHACTNVGSNSKKKKSCQTKEILE